MLVPDDPGRRPAHLQLLAISWNFGWPVAAGVIAGYWIDDRLGSSPWATLGLGLGAMGIATQRLVRLSNEDARERREEDEEARRRMEQDEAQRPKPPPPEEIDEEAELARVLAGLREAEPDDDERR